MLTSQDVVCTLHVRSNSELSHPLEQTQDTCKLKHKNVKYTEGDCQEFAKTVIRSLASAYRTHIDPERKGKQRLDSHTKNRRVGRQHQVSLDLKCRQARILTHSY